MKNTERWNAIVKEIGEYGFLTVAELSEKFQVSAMTIRRDLEKLAAEGRIQRPYGGAAPLRPELTERKTEPSQTEQPPECKPPGGECDVLILGSLDPRFNLLISERRRLKRLPTVAESLPLPGALTWVGVNNYQAGLALGRWAAQYCRQHWAGRASVLDLTYSFDNTVERSQGFLEGLRLNLSSEVEVLSLNAQANYDQAYQFAHDALSVHPGINLVFAINDITAWGAINACADLGVNPEQLLVLPFGLEGSQLKNALMAGRYCKAGLAMFPEIVGPACVEAAISAFNQASLPPQVVTPYAILTSETLGNFYARDGSQWKLRWETVRANFGDVFDFGAARPPRQPLRLPRCVGTLLPFHEHEWYQNLRLMIHAYAARLGIGIEDMDAEQVMKDELEHRRRGIALQALREIEDENVLILDAGPINQYLAEALSEQRGLTVITNSMPVFKMLENQPAITLVSTGGILRRNSQALVGPTAEKSLQDLRADLLFLNVSGVSLQFGLSHTTISEVSIKQAMLRSARQVILLADHTCFAEESTLQVAPLSAVHKLISDDALPANLRLRLSQLGIKVVIAKT